MGVRYLLAGGLAVVAHGYVRASQDIDLVVALDRENALKTVRSLMALGYRPMAPVPAESFAEADTRTSWAKDKGMTVFSLK